jgi:hypothetical protein
MSHSLAEEQKMKKVMIVMLCLGLAGVALGGAGQIKWQRWDGNTTGAEVGDTLATVLAFITGVPTIDSVLNEFHMPDQTNIDNFNALLTGWVKPPVSGAYKFFVSSDDDSLVWLSPNANAADKVLIAQVNGWTNDMDWGNAMAFPSGWINLVGGKSYFIQQLMGDGTGGGHCAVGWQGPGITTTTVIPGIYLSDTMPTDWPSLVNQITINPNPADKAVGAAFPALTLSWEKNATIVPAPPAPGIKKYKVFFGTTPKVGEPNSLEPYFKADVAVPTTQLAVTGLASGTTYYWRVDTYVNDSNRVYGPLWSFTTKEVKPVIDTQPTIAKVGPNCLGTFTIAARSGEEGNGGPLTYAWKKVGSATVLGTLTSYSTNVAGMYYCDVTNTSGTTTSAQAELKVMSHSLGDLTPVAIGTGAVAGVGVTQTGSTITMVGSGDDIWNAADGFEYAYVQLSGDFDISVRITNFTTTNTDGWSKCGIMVRQDLSVGSPHIIAGASSGNGFTMQGRQDANTGNNGNHTGQGGMTGAYPYGMAQVWVRMVRAGNSFSVFSSPDGVNWTLYPASATENTVTISDPWIRNFTDPVYIGLACCAHSTASLATATFDNLQGLGNTWKATNGDFTPKTPEGWANPVVDTTFSWGKSEFSPCGATYKVNGGTDAGALTLLGETAPDVMQFTVPKNTLIEFNKTYFWRVDTYYGGDQEQGTVWTFDSVKQVPVIRSGPAAITVVNAGATATLDVDTTTSQVPVEVPMVKYEWFQGATKVFEGVPSLVSTDGAGVKHYSCPLVLSNVQVGTEGYYTCKVTNTAGSTTSPVGIVRTHRLMLHYTFDAVDGTMIPDSSASVMNATLVSPNAGKTPVYGGLVTGMIGKAIQLVGPNDPNGAYIAVNQKAIDLGVSGALPRSVSVWAKVQLFNDAGLYDMGAFADAADFSLRTLTDTTQRWRVQYWGGADRDMDIVPSFNNWIHTVLVNDGVNNQLYVNGKQILAWAGTLNTSTTNALVIGYWNGSRLVGQLDDFRLYNYALTAKEAGALYAAVSGTTFCAQPMAYDFNGDCQVDIVDFATFAAQWAKTGIVK